MIFGSVSVGVLVIGDELLSGYVQDLNCQAIAGFLQPLGIQVAEVRMVGDAQEAIVSALNDLRTRYEYVFTTGGIGSTHDDKTADAVAAAFGIGIGIREDARAMLSSHYGGRPLDGAQLRMARIPHDACLIPNPISGAPGFSLGNVFVLAGVPEVMRAMLKSVRPRLKGGRVVKSIGVRGWGVMESEIAAGLARLEESSGGKVAFGSYPWFAKGEHGVRLVARSVEPHALEQAAKDLAALIRSVGAEPAPIDDCC